MGKTEEHNPNLDHFLSTLKKFHRKSVIVHHRSSAGGIPSSERRSLGKASGGSYPTKNALAVPAGSDRKGSSTHRKAHNVSVASGGSGASSGGSSGGSGTTQRKRRKTKKKDKKDTLLSRFRDIIAESDVFVEQSTESPHLTCIRISLISLVPFTVILLWDIFAILLFEIPHLSLVDLPGFALIFQFVAILLAMYGYSVQFVATGSSGRYLTKAKIALVGQFILFGLRVLMEVFCDGLRYQENNYLPKPWSSFS